MRCARCPLQAATITRTAYLMPQASSSSDSGRQAVFAACAPASPGMLLSRPGMLFSSQTMHGAHTSSAHGCSCTRKATDR